jgi:hypothetical protein
MVLKGAVVVDIKVLYRNLWVCFEENFETPLSLVFSWQSLESSVSLVQVKSLLRACPCSVFRKFMLSELLQGMSPEE